MANLSQIKRDRMKAFLETLKEANSSDEQIKAINEIENFLDEKRYGLVWEEHEEQVDVMMRDNIPVFTEDESKKIISDPEKPMNFILEGDNLHSLYLLEKTHKGKVDIIYIDPPYNTTNEGFTYDDKKVDINDGFRHSKWISFMQKRIKIAKNILSPNGILFISIDDNEYQNIKSLCDEMFGTTSFVTSFIWQKKTGASDAKGIATITEYILCYCNNQDKSKWNNIFSQNFGSYDKNRYRYTDDYYDERGPFYFDNLDRGGLTYSDSMNFGVEAPDGTIVFPNGRQEFENDGWIWKWSKNKIEWGFENGFLEFQKSSNKQGGWALKYKNYLNVDNEGNPIDRSAPFKNLIQFVINQAGTNELKSMFNNQSPFSNPKPSDLIKYLISLSNKQDALVVDFFAGSGTTGHAILKLNKEDGGERRFILATNNENNIAETITFERIKKVINGYKTSSKASDLLYEYKFTFSKLNKADEVLQNVAKVISENEDKYETITKTMKDNTLIVQGEYKKNSMVAGIPSNLKYFKTDFIPRTTDEDDSLTDNLLDHIKEMVELELSVDLLTSQNVKIVMDECELDEFFEEDTNSDVTLLLPTFVLLKGAQEYVAEQRNITLIRVPDYYFATELREAGEL
ncbi:site-specific DNA-methyltransferase [Turicibacter sanguinis]|nr:site-specific DNA-methyltransferase [Turicibacter sanguinis]MTN83147.1 site-specific DNA-methyltransferase [Turicibacter sanguinis]MTN86075.1 site-specific DNA-methyltransferase [Turicibacter sanguinis]MTN89172.1 site-specific DNA-methyltransferase [Turicibacter sanguinis]MTN93944.1 site-specific DNA-methyltransferase [Turicibacter sanguinis]